MQESLHSGENRDAGLLHKLEFMKDSESGMAFYRKPADKKGKSSRRSCLIYPFLRQAFIGERN